MHRIARTVMFVACAGLAACAAQKTVQHDVAWSASKQLVLVVTPDWNTHEGTLRTYSRDGDAWREVGNATPVVTGKSGAAWGIGLHPPQSGGPTKREGDGRSPAGVFPIGTAFGYAASEPTSLPFMALSESDYCVDVSGSPLYNRIVDAKRVDAAAVAGSTEPMRRDLHANGDSAYKIGFVIEHNPHGVPGAGSCIFAHLWKSPDWWTAGCTAMTEASMRKLVAWLKPDAQPVFVLLPQDEYRRLRTTWQLP